MKRLRDSDRIPRAPVAIRSLAGLLLLLSWLPCLRAGAQAGSEAAPTTFRVMLAAGAGFGHRDVMLPARPGSRLLESAVFPALGVSLEGHAPFGARGLFGLRIHYQTSLGLRASEEPAAGSGKETSLRSHQLQLGITPGLRFADSPESVVLRLFAGWGFRGLRAVTDGALPQYTLHGPVLRPELYLPFADSAALRFGPECQLISGISDDLRRIATTAAYGFAWGAVIELDVQLTNAFRLHLDYRESHARVRSAWGQALTDTERFATLGLKLQNP